MSKVRECICCSKSYRYCGNCGEFAQYPSWMAEFDSEVCHEVFNVISGYNMGVMTKDDIKKVIDKFNIRDFSVFKDSISSKLNKLFPIEPVEEKSEIVIEVEEIAETSDEENIEEVKPEKSYSYKKNSKKKNRNVDIDLTESE